MNVAHLPQQPTTLIGRVEETAGIVARINDPGCRLLTLLGPGGIGKTRLALHAAGQEQVDFSDGVLFVDLQPAMVEEVTVGSGILLTAIADACNLPLAGQGEPQQQLFAYMSDKEILLVLDQFEPFLAGEILPESISLLSGILESAPAVTLLITSRSALNLREEWLYPVEGLPVPADPADEHMNYGAVQLFVERARRIQPDFSAADQREGLVRICQLVEGMPLALELAASWTKMLSCDAIATEIKQNLDFLGTTLRNVPDRHRSMQAVFEQSWALLRPQEQQVFARLSVFRGGFTRRAARQIAEASLPVLSTLVDHSLLRWENGRYHVHGLLHQYAAGKLARLGGEEEEIRARHTAFFIAFLRARWDDLMGGRQQAATLEIEQERENVRLAWQHAVTSADSEQIAGAVQPLSLFFQFQSRYREGIRAFSSALAKLAETSRVRLLVLLERAWFQIRLGRLEEAEEALGQCQSIYERLDIPPLPGHGTDPHLPLGIIASIRGDYTEAARLAEAARRASEKHEQPWNRQVAYYLLGRMAFVQGNYNAAGQYAEKAYAITRENGDRWFMAYCLNELGNVAAAQGNVAVAEGHYTAGYAIGEEFNDPEGMAVALVHLGGTALLKRDFAEARRRFRESWKIYKEIGDHGGLAAALDGLGKTALAQRDYGQARDFFDEALKIAAGIDYLPLILSIFVGIGRLWVESGRPQQGVALLVVVRRHPAGERETVEAARRQLQRAREQLAPESYRSATEEHEGEALATVIETVLATLAASSVEAEEAGARKTATAAEDEQPLVEPLTARELEVLRLIAQGLTNQEVADELVISVGTVKWYTSQIYGKLEVGNRTAAVARARELDLL